LSNTKIEGAKKKKNLESVTLRWKGSFAGARNEKTWLRKGGHLHQRRGKKTQDGGEGEKGCCGL